MKTRLTSIFVGLLVLALAPDAVLAQGGYINQNEVEEVISIRSQSLDEIPEVHYNYHYFYHPMENSVLARNDFYREIGDGDTERGRQRSRLVELLNRQLMQDVNIGDTLIVPTNFDEDFRAYSPFPRYYPGARDFDKLFIIHKGVQAWAAYEYGELVRWGIVNTGLAGEYPTPNGRFNFNWKQEYRVSTLSPPNEPWEMYWVFNFHHLRGIHIHQYAMPTGGPTSRGCVRLVDADARWIYEWADPWETTAGTHIGPGSAEGRILEQGTTVLVLGDDPEGDPEPFEFKDRYPVLQRLDLPSDPYDVEPGTDQQRHFDRMRAQASN